MTRHDGFLWLLGPGAILAIWIFLPWGRSEAWRAGDEPTTAIVELVGYAFEAPAGGRPWLLGRGAEAGFRLHSAPVAPRAAWLAPPDGDRASWSILPAGAGLTLRLLTDPDRRTETQMPPRVTETSIRPWRQERGAEPRTLGCDNPLAVLAPVRLRDGWPNAGVAALSSAWGARFSTGDDERWLLPWSESFAAPGLWLSMSGPTPSWLRVGVAAQDPPDRLPDPVPICRSGDDEPAPRDGTDRGRTMIGPLALRDGDLLAIGRTRFLVRIEAGRQSLHRLELHHVRDPEAPGYFRASAGHSTYHPNRRALWGLPPCGETGATRQAPLTLAVEPGRETAEEVSVAELALSDRLRQAQIDAAARDHDRPHELPAVAPGRAVERALLSLCTHPDSGGRRAELGVRLVADSATGIGMWTGPGDDLTALNTGAHALSIGTAGRPRELLIDLGGNLLRVAPATAPRLTRRTRAGLAAFLILVLALQAWPLTRARIRARRAARRAERTGSAGAGDAWPAALATPTLQQAAGIAITCLLFLGASFHLLLGLHPDLVGKPDYLQAFLQGTVAVCVMLAAAAGFSAGRGLEQRCAAAGLGAALTLLAAAGWWWWDGTGGGSAEGFWHSAWRDRASAAAGAGPEATGELLSTAGWLGVAAAAGLLFAARLRWSRAAEALARVALRAPLAGFVALVVAGLALGALQRSALAFELAILAGLAWYAAVYWAFVRQGRLIRGDHLRRQAAARSMASGLLVLLFLAIFFLVGADLPDAASFTSVAAGSGVAGGALRIARAERSTSLLRMVWLWAPASILGVAFASFVLRDMGSVAAWLPALLTGFFLWLVRPEEIDRRREEPRKALSHLLLALGAGLILLGLLDVFKVAAHSLDWQVLERPRQRLALAEDISYITAGEWITQVRWLASQQDDTLQWVPNVNSDVAIFGLAANLGFGWAVIASVVLLAIAGCAALAADHAIREARAAALKSGGDRLRPVLYRALGLTLGMVGVLLICQWLVHLATGVVLHLPITGLVFPWLSHGNTTHLLYAAAILLPMAAVSALGDDGR